MSASEQNDFIKRARQYCAKAERCTQDVIRKLSDWSTPEETVESILEQLRLENFLDDHRYANSFVSDKWKLDQWGRAKIRHGLILKGFRDQEIQHALDIIDPDEYLRIMDGVLSRKRDTMYTEPPIQQMKKIISFGTSRGYEEELVWQWLEKEGLSFTAENSNHDR